MVKWLALKQSEKDRLLGLETEVEYRQRWISIRVLYFTSYLMFLAFGIVATGIWPYLKNLDPSAAKVFLAYAFAVPPLGQLIVSPLFGWWSNKLPSIRLPLVLLVTVFTIANVIYAIIEEFPDNRKYVLLVCRALIGVGTSSVAICRAYVSSATRLSERTKTISYMALAQSMGLMVGPIFQSAFSLIGEQGFRFAGLFRVNMYTVAGWSCAFLGVINLILLTPRVFKDRPIALREAMINQGAANAKETWKSVELQYLPIAMVLVSFSLLMFSHVAFQTLLSPIALDQFNWTNEESLFYLGILMTAGALISCVLFLLLDFLCKRFSESNVLVYGAMLALFFSQILMIPVGNEPITATSDGLNATNGNSSCPSIQDWCRWIPPVGKIQFTIAYTLLCTAFSIGTTLSQSVFSKLLGPRPQGTWMALLTCAGSAARILGPGSVTVYVLYGTYWTFGVCTVLAGTIFIWMWVYRDRLQSTKLVQPKVEEELKVLNPTRLTQ
ncbi:major facilitator superfamily domain-containing protein 8-like isoform X2 [Toxorhynchites rutilus septentrionalis]|uniref:major facilitator superfamily domain-containing protein 8-like isoform X2 n=1 Tax=Toxorhynchites rutilus septentrionalis TaxID=329112 RepID=UPI002478F113|nr:major facilitator superfamily domain-containing protein 8-like isoform X2 [Toxorhynchites rutilus septentrionalis]